MNYYACAGCWWMYQKLISLCQSYPTGNSNFRECYNKVAKSWRTRIKFTPIWPAQKASLDLTVDLNSLFQNGNLLNSVNQIDGGHDRDFWSTTKTTTLGPNFDVDFSLSNRTMRLQSNFAVDFGEWWNSTRFQGRIWGSKSCRLLNFCQFNSHVDYSRY